MHDRKRLAVHGVGKHRPSPLGVIQAQTSHKANWFITHFEFAAIGTPKHYFSRIRFKTGPVQNFRRVATSIQGD
jgi:hypothetical protein